MLPAIRRPRRHVLRVLLPATAGLLLLVNPSFAPPTRGEAPSVTPAAAVARETVVRTVQTMLRAWETGDVERFASTLHERILFAYPGGRLDRGELLRTFREYAAAKRDVRLYFGRCLVEGDRFALEYQFAATDRASGVRQAVGSAAAGQVEDGRVVLFKEFYDEHVAPRQARGEIPLDEGQPFPYPASVVMTPEHIN